MQGNRSRDTKPELAIRSLLHAAGLRYRVNRSPLKGVRRRADIVFGPAKVVVFVDGCFWHGCPNHFVAPKTNPGYWGPKISRNVERDRRYDEALRSEGWTVVRVWEHQPVPEALEQVEAAIRQR